MNSASRFIDRRAPWLTLAALCALGLAALWRPTHSPKHPNLPEPRPKPTAVSRPATAPTKVTSTTPDDSSPEARVQKAIADGASWQAIQDLLEELALRNPALALEWAEKLGPSDKERYLAMVGIVQRWARREPQAALDWSIRQGRRWDAMDVSFPYLVLNRVAQSDPSAVIALTQNTLTHWTSRPGSDPNELAYTAINALFAAGESRRAREAIEHWAAADLVDRMGRDTLERVAWRMTDDGSPSETLTWLQTLPASEIRNEVLGTVAARWAQQEPKAAAVWAEALSEKEGHAEAMHRALAAWAEKDFPEAANWLSQRETDPAADPIWADFASQANVTRNDPAMALKFAALISNPDLRQTTTESVLAAWHERDPAAVVRYVSTSPTFTPLVRQRLLTELAGN